MGRGLPPHRRRARQQVGNALFVERNHLLMAMRVSHLRQHWQMMGALEALNRMLLFGLTTDPSTALTVHYCAVTLESF